jgi:hypothetical protein
VVRVRLTANATVLLTQGADDLGQKAVTINKIFKCFFFWGGGLWF